MPGTMYEQLKALWLARDKEHSFVRGYLKTKIKRDYLNGHSEAGASVVERWFTLLGHSLFHCMQKESLEFSGALLTDVFNPVIARVNEKTFNSFSVEENLQANSLYLEGMLMGDVDILLCPSSADEKRTWLALLQDAGVINSLQNKSPVGNDGRKKVVIIDADVNDKLYSQHESVMSPDQHRAWKHQWKVVARRVLSLPDAAQIRMKQEALVRLVNNEQRYVNDLTTLVEVYRRPMRMAIASGLVTTPWTKLDALFLNCESLLTFHKLFFSQMRASIALPNPKFGELLLQFIPHMGLYVDYVKSQGQNIKVLEDCLNNPSFTDYLENYHSSHDCEAQHLRVLLKQPLSRLEIYEAFVEETLKQTCESHSDYIPLGAALQALGDLKRSLANQTGVYDQQESMLGILSSVGPRGLLLLDPDCSLIMKCDSYLPASSKWTTGTIKQRKVRCHLYTTALVVVSGDKKVKSQLLPLCGATVYENVSVTGEVTYAKDPEVEVRALKLYSPNGPRNGVVIIFHTHSTKSIWLNRIREMIKQCTPEGSPSPPRRDSVGGQIPTSPPQHISSPPLTPIIHPSPSSTLLKLAAVPRCASLMPSQPLLTHHLSSPPIVSRSLLSSSTSNLSSFGKTEREMSLTSSGDLLKLSDSTQRAGITRSLSMFLVPAEADAESAPVHPKAAQAVQNYYSISALFSLLTSHPPSPRYPSIFLLTYRMFTNAHEVLDALIDEHRRGLDRRIPYTKHFALPSESLRFFNTLRIWINKYFVDFHHDVSLKQMLMVYLNSIRNHKCLHTKEGELVDSLLKTVHTRGHIPLIRKSKLKIEVPKAVGVLYNSLLSIPAELLAKQLTWMEHEIYSRIKPYEFLQQKWTKKNRLEQAPNICYVISRFNEVTGWLAKEVLSPEHPRKRCALVQYLIEVAKHCLKLGNFVTVFQITSALCSSSIQRLKKTWDHLPHSIWETFQELKALTSVDSASKIYRLAQKSSPSPSVPYIGPYLSLLVSIEVGMSTFVKDPPEHVNFQKLTKLASVIEEVTRFQNPKYSILADGAVLVYLDKQIEGSREFDEEQVYSRSIEVEPRQKQQISRHRKKSFSNLLSGD